MSGKRNQRNQEELRQLLEGEFLVHSDTWEREDVERAEAALAVYESVEDFLEVSGWRRDNPELVSEKYLTENHICRWVKDKFIYFSRIIWDMGRREQAEEKWEDYEGDTDSVCQYDVCCHDYFCNIFNRKDRYLNKGAEEV